MKLRVPTLLAAGLVATLAALAPQAPGSARPPRADDDEEQAEARLVAERAFVENCLMCHGAELTARQRLTPKQWAAEVEKMIGWGTPLPPDRKDGLIAYLSETYPPGKPLEAPARITPEAALATDRQDAPADADLRAADPAHGSALFAQHCATCHGPAARGGEIGVNLVAKPVLLRRDEFQSLLAHGRRRMPGFAPVLDAQGQSDLLAHLRRQR